MSAMERADGEYALQGKWGSSCPSYVEKKINKLHVTLFSIQ